MSFIDQDGPFVGPVFQLDDIDDDIVAFDLDDTIPPFVGSIFQLDDIVAFDLDDEGNVIPPLRIIMMHKNTTIKQLHFLYLLISLTFPTSLDILRPIYPESLLRIAEEVPTKIISHNENNITIAFTKQAGYVVSNYVLHGKYKYYNYKSTIKKKLFRGKGVNQYMKLIEILYKGDIVIMTFYITFSFTIDNIMMKIADLLPKIMDIDI